MSYFRKSILLFAFMFGMFSAPYASACDLINGHNCCLNVAANVAAVQAYCPSSPSIRNATNACDFAFDDASTIRLCNKYPQAFQVKYYCPEGANGSPCACVKGKNWDTTYQKCK